MNPSHNLRHRKHLNSCFFTILFGFLSILSVNSLEAAIVPTGNVEPAGIWDKLTEGHIGRYSDGSLTVNGGSQLKSDSADLGTYNGAKGIVAVTGVGSSWTNYHQLSIGYQGIGTLTVSTGGHVYTNSGYLGYSSGSTGTATVAGTGSWFEIYDTLYVGYGGNGLLTIEAGGKVSCKSGWIGGATGTVTVTGPGSFWTNSGDLTIGNNKNGVLTVSDGGAVTAGTLWASLSALHGNGTITTTQGAVLDADLRFDASHGKQASVAFGSGGTLNVNAAGGKLGVGFNGTGSLAIVDGISISGGDGILGYNSGSSGTATVNGAGSKWTNIQLNVGYFGNGSLSIGSGGQISNSNCRLGYFPGSTGTATITGTGSKLTTSGTLTVGDSGSGSLTVSDGGAVTAGTLCASLGDLHGNGTITTMQGAVLDADLRFDAIHGIQNTLAFGNSGTLIVNAAGGVSGDRLGCGYKKNGSLTIADGIAISSFSGTLGTRSGSVGTASVIGAGSKWTNTSTLEIGILGNGTLNIQEGGQVSDNYGYIGYYPLSTGVVTVADAGSKWTTNRQLNIGSQGSGMLNIEAGGEVSDGEGYIGYSSGSTGVVTVTGTSSKWNNINYLFVGKDGSGLLNVRAGGIVSANSIAVNNSSLLTIDAGYGSTLKLTGGSYNGMTRFLVAPGPVAGSQYSPIQGTSMVFVGNYQALGGTWNQTNNIFTVSQTQNGIAGSPLSIDAAQVQRVLVNDSSSGWKVGVSFLTKTGTEKNINLTASVPDVTSLSSLQHSIGVGHSVLNAWNFTAQGSGYISTDPVYLSFAVDGGQTSSLLELWRFDGTTWSNFSAVDLTCNDGYASFTATGLSSYAIAASLPLPAWKTDSDSSWQIGSNWTNGSNAPNGVNAAAILGPAITAPRTITVNGLLTLGELTFKSTQHYTLAGSDSLTLQVNPGYNAKIEVQASDTNGHVIETPITLLSPLDISIAPASFLTLAGQVQNPAGQTMTLSGGGTLTVTQGIATSGTINVLSGTLSSPSLAADTLTIGNVSTASLAAVPEPSTTILLLAAIAAIAGRFLLRMKKLSESRFFLNGIK